jgi:hypothetical protein
MNGEGAEVPHPRDDPRFEVEFNDFPGGWPRWRRMFKQAAVAYYRSHVEPFMSEDEDAEVQLSLGHYAHQQLYYEVKSRVNAAAHGVADQAGVTHRNLSLWLVKERGFPWRQDCAVPDLLRLLAFLQDTDTVVAARAAPDYPEKLAPPLGHAPTNSIGATGSEPGKPDQTCRGRGSCSR